MKLQRDPCLEELIEHAPQSAAQIRKVMDTLFLNLAQKSSFPNAGNVIEAVAYADMEDLNLDIHTPEGDGPFPVLVYLHGGGFIFGSSKSYDHVCRRFAACGYLTFSVNYRLAPENPFPAGFDDCCRAIEWVVENAQNYNGEAGKIALAGDSAGGNIAAGAAIQFSESKSLQIAALGLIYAVLLPPDLAVYEEHGPVPKLLLDAYIGTNEYQSMVNDWRYNPMLKAEVLPPTCLICGMADPLIADSQIMADKLKSCGIVCDEVYFDDIPHGFIQMDSIFQEAGEGIENLIRFLDANFSKK